MLKAKDMSNVFEDDGWVADDPQGQITLAQIKADLQQRFQGYSLPVEIADDVVKCGGLFSKDDRPGMTFTHVEHRRDYLKYVVFIKQEYGRTYISFRSAGQSKLMKKQQKKDYNQAFRSEFAQSQGGIGAHLGAATANAISGIGSGKRKEKLENEERYYDMLIRAIGETMSAFGMA